MGCSCSGLPVKDLAAGVTTIAEAPEARRAQSIKQHERCVGARGKEGELLTGRRVKDAGFALGLLAYDHAAT